MAGIRLEKAQRKTTRRRKKGKIYSCDVLQQKRRADKEKKGRELLPGDG